MQAGGWFVPWTMGMQKYAVLPMGGMVPLVPPLLAALPPAPPPLRLIAPPQLPHQQQPGRKIYLLIVIGERYCPNSSSSDINIVRSEGRMTRKMPVKELLIQFKDGRR
ncbi:hypothetical protein MSG28_002013 [Choristoneura fumiferana]|uniref:Uncharacterized protein n=1 Tax=Choristoneura fumiferana TaxID=7141 RepID=A0ACC0JU37_CHOFU|nr:hypothetical protein MSG28_002013 [Choristoneura fumiferana]